MERTPPIARDPAALTADDFVIDYGMWTTRLPMTSWEAAGMLVGYAPEGRSQAPLEPEEIARVQWVADHERELFDAVMAAVLAEYPALREEALAATDGELADELPVITRPEELRHVLALGNVYVHPLDGGPFVGFSFASPIDDEHGVGVLVRGTQVVEVAQADVAFVKWMAERHAA
ncbi:hypothetical protein DVA67_022200 [Solirubrobacter sp. CPCC 204708]|uniref:DUF6985 domain-containing protein n=1 Tax=Solirubrobacter deserti TaxID=2282478 RepID=A0ABT4RTT5_9ACTN|nr:hypothetical protein [Solirubrobacter deserti]MBE2318706.1 hypothetical protein [Solirubrobacter deserti]MDA0141983.1 hypothetical protein [Solirubrobacter deserti]